MVKKSKKTPAKKATAKKQPPKRTGKKPAERKRSKAAVTAKKSVAKKSVAKKSVAKKSVAKKPVAKKPVAKKEPKEKVRKTAMPNKTAKTAQLSQTAPERIRDETLRKQLIKNREEIVREAKSEIAKYITGEARQLVESVLDDGDWSVVDLSEDVNLRRLAAHREVLLKIDEALRKLREGTYGICEDCGDTIHTERLKVLPFAIYCRDCQEKREELQKVGTEEL